MPDNQHDTADLDALLRAVGAPTKLDEAIAQLESEKQQLENKHYEERFVWIVVCIVLFDALIFIQMANWAGALVIGVIQLIAMVIIADRCNVDAVKPIIDKMAGGFAKHVHKPEGEK